MGRTDRNSDVVIVLMPLRSILPSSPVRPIVDGEKQKHGRIC